MGDKDFFKDALKEKNALFYYEKANLKPGKPVTLTKLNQSIIIRLTGQSFKLLIGFMSFDSTLIGALIFK
ncbi:hypothetical protein HpHA86_00070 [Helicobacter pylori]